MEAMRDFNTNLVSVQGSQCFRAKRCIHISIQILCRFKRPRCKRCWRVCTISIQILCRFKTYDGSCGLFYFIYFNTNLVSVQDHFEYSVNGFDEYFNTNLVSVQATTDVVNFNDRAFQYKSCVGSSKALNVLNMA